MKVLLILCTVEAAWAARKNKKEEYLDTSSSSGCPREEDIFKKGWIPSTDFLLASQSNQDLWSSVLLTDEEHESWTEDTKEGEVQEYSNLVAAELGLHLQYEKKDTSGIWTREFVNGIGVVSGDGLKMPNPKIWTRRWKHVVCKVKAGTKINTASTCTNYAVQGKWTELFTNCGEFDVNAVQYGKAWQFKVVSQSKSKFDTWKNGGEAIDKAPDSSLNTPMPDGAGTTTLLEMRGGVSWDSISGTHGEKIERWQHVGRKNYVTKGNTDVLELNTKFEMAVVGLELEPLEKFVKQATRRRKTSFRAEWKQTWGEREFKSCTFGYAGMCNTDWNHCAPLDDHPWTGWHWACDFEIVERSGRACNVGASRPEWKCSLLMKGNVACVEDDSKYRCCNSDTRFRDGEVDDNNCGWR